MENPRVVNRSVIGLFGALTVIALVSSLRTAEWSIFFGWLVVMTLFCLLCVVGALLNMAIFIPVFRLMGKVDRKLNARGGKAHRTSE